MASIPGYYSVRGKEAVIQLAREGRLVATTEGGLGLYSARLIYTGPSPDGTTRDDMFAFSCFHGHKTKQAAQGCANKKIRQLSKTS